MISRRNPFAVHYDGCEPLFVLMLDNKGPVHEFCRNARQNCGVEDGDEADGSPDDLKELERIIASPEQDSPPADCRVLGKQQKGVS